MYSVGCTTDCYVDGMSNSAAARLFRIDRRTVANILKHSIPPRDFLEGPTIRPKLDPFEAIMDQILADDMSRIKKQHHTTKRIHERQRDARGFPGGLRLLRIMCERRIFGPERCLCLRRMHQAMPKWNLARRLGWPALSNASCITLRWYCRNGAHFLSRRRGQYGMATSAATNIEFCNAGLS